MDGSSAAASGLVRWKCTVVSSLSAAVILANDNASAVTPAITLLSDLGSGIALSVAAAAGVFLVRRRRAEAALLYARGEHVVVFAGRSALEAALPTLLGGAAGFGLAYGLTNTFAPAGSISAGDALGGCRARCGRRDRGARSARRGGRGLVPGSV